MALATVCVSVYHALQQSCQKRYKLGSQNLYCGLPQGLYFCDKISCFWVRGFPSKEGVKKEVPTTPTLKVFFKFYLYWLL